jgi:hypothetical protein
MKDEEKALYVKQDTDESLPDHVLQENIVGFQSLRSTTPGRSRMQDALLKHKRMFRMAKDVLRGGYMADAMIGVPGALTRNQAIDFLRHRAGWSDEKIANFEKTESIFQEGSPLVEAFDLEERNLRQRTVMAVRSALGKLRVQAQDLLSYYNEMGNEEAKQHAFTIKKSVDTALTSAGFLMSAEGLRRMEARDYRLGPSRYNPQEDPGGPDDICYWCGKNLPDNAVEDSFCCQACKKKCVKGGKKPGPGYNAKADKHAKSKRRKGPKRSIRDLKKKTEGLTERSEIQVDDWVVYSRKFCQSIGAYTGDIPFAVGLVLDIQPLGKDPNSTVLATVDWGDGREPTKVNVANLIKRDEIHLEPR